MEFYDQKDQIGLVENRKILRRLFLYNVKILVIVYIPKVKNRKCGS